MQVLENKKFVGIERCDDTILLSFGETIIKLFEEDVERELPEFSLELQCPFRISRNGEILVAGDDLYEVEEDCEEADWNIYGNNKFDNVAEEIIEVLLPVVVKKVNLSPMGDLEILLENNIKIDVFVNTSVIKESWRCINFNTCEVFTFREE